MNRQVAGGLRQDREKQTKKKELIFESAEKADFKEMMPGVTSPTSRIRGYY